VSTLSARVFHYVRRHQLFSAHATIVAAVSGGGDSTALLSVLAEAPPTMRLRVHAAHVHHGIRVEADEDESAVRSLCDRLGVPLVCVRLATLEPGGPALESRARAARYAALGRVAEDVGASAVLTGHTLDDQAETVLMRLLRGAGPDALAAMPPIRPMTSSVSLARPLLAERRAQLRRYLRTRAIEWREDVTNDGAFAFRNRIRSRVLPLLAEENPRIASSLGHLAEILRDEAAFWATRVDEAFATVVQEDGQRWRFDCRRFAALPVALQRRLIQRIADGVARTAGMDVDLGFVHVEEVRRLATAAQAGREIELPRGLRARRVGWAMEIGAYSASRREQPHEPNWGVSLAVPGRALVVDMGILVEASLTAPKEPLEIAPGHWRIVLPARFQNADLRIRGARAGDRIRLPGLSGHRLVMDLLAEAGVSRWDRADAPVLTANGDVVWVLGVRAGAEASGEAPGVLIRAWPLEASGAADIDGT